MSYKEISPDAASAAGADATTTPGTSSPSVLQRGVDMLGNGWTYVKGYLPDVSNVYIDPINPKSDITLSDRTHLIMRETRPWFQEFFAVSQFNLPPFPQMKTRLEHNITTFFYNYFILTLIHLVVSTIMRPMPIIMLAIYIAAVYALFVWKKDDIELSHGFVIDQNVKLVLAAVLFVLFFLFGHILFPIFYTALFILIVVGVHGLFHDDEPADDAPVVA